MKKYSLELKLFLLTFLTFFIWLLNLHPYILLCIYGVLFCYFIYKQKSIHSYIIIIVFSVMSKQTSSSFILVEYCLIQFLFCFTLFYCIKEKRIVLGKLLFPLLIYLIYNSLSLLWTPVLAYGINGLFAIVEGYLVYFIITNRSTEIKKFDIITNIASFVMFTLTLEIFSLYIRYGINPIIDNKNLLRLGWSMSNILASIYVLLIPVSLYKYINQKKVYLVYIVIDILNFFGLIMTLSRGAYLGAFISILLFFIVFTNKKMILRYGGVLGFIFLIIYSFRNKLFPIIIKYLKDRNLFNDRNRNQIYKLGWEKFKQHPLFGQGIKSSEYMINHYLQKPYAHYHNFILQIAATLGIVGLILFASIIYHWFKILDKKKDPFVLCIIFSIIGGLTHQLVDVSFDLFFFGVYFYVLIGLVEVYRHEDADDCLKMKIIVKETSK